MYKFDREGWKAVTDDIRRRIADVRDQLDRNVSVSPRPVVEERVEKPKIEPAVVQEPKQKSPAELYKEKLRKKKNG